MGLTDEERQNYQKALDYHEDAVEMLTRLVHALNRAGRHKGALAAQEALCALGGAQVYLAGMRGALDGSLATGGTVTRSLDELRRIGTKERFEDKLGPGPGNDSP